MKIKKILLTSALVLSTYSAIAQTQVIAHRGYWKTDGSAQNSIAALLKADSIGCYGSEFDVWLTADDKLVVNHDPIFKLKSMERSTAATLTSLKLDNGEQLPTLEQYLKAAKKTKTQLILELKAHSRPERETLAVEKNSKYGQEVRIGKENGVHYLFIACHQRVYPVGTCRYACILPGWKINPERIKRNGMCRTGLSPECFPETSRMDQRMS